MSRAVSARSESPGLKTIYLLSFDQAEAETGAFRRGASSERLAARTFEAPPRALKLRFGCSRGFPVAEVVGDKSQERPRRARSRLYISYWLNCNAATNISEASCVTGNALPF